MTFLPQTPRPVRARGLQELHRLNRRNCLIDPEARRRSRRRRILIAVCWLVGLVGSACGSLALLRSSQARPATAVQAPDEIQSEPAPAAAEPAARESFLPDAPPASPDRIVPLAMAPAEPGRPPTPPRAPAPAYRRMHLMVTAYCPCGICCGNWAQRSRRRFADGTSLSAVTAALAADTDVFPFGTQIRVPGYAADVPVRVVDRGRAVKGRHIEVFFQGPDAHRRAQRWGVRMMDVHVLLPSGAR